MSFAAQAWLYLLVILPLGAVFYYCMEKRMWRQLGRFAGPGRLGSLASSYSPTRRSVKCALTLAAASLIILALARPRWGRHFEEVKAKGIDVLFALDASRSMLAQDVKPNRLERAKLAMLDLVSRLRGDRTGLIAFSGGAFLQCPLTLDYDAFRQTLETIDTEIIPQPGTDIAAAIAEAQAAFRQGNNYKILILITDGEDLEAEAVSQAAKAAEDGVKIYTVGVGSAEGDLIPLQTEDGGTEFVRDASGNPVKTRLDETTLTAVASATGAFYVPLGSTGQGLEEVYKLGLQKIPGAERKARLHEIPIERFQWPLGLGLFLLVTEGLIGTRRRRSGAVSMAVFLLAAGSLATPHPSTASPSAALQAYEEGRYEEAAELYQKAIEEKPDDPRLHFNLGASLYQQSDYEAASNSFAKALSAGESALQADAFYNLGNTRFQEGEAARRMSPREAVQLWEDGLKQYQNALHINPDHEDARLNQDLLQKRLEELKKQLEQQQRQNGDKPEDKEQKQEREPEQEGQKENREQQQDQQQEQRDGKKGETKQEKEQKKQQGEKESQKQQGGEGKEQEGRQAQPRGGKEKQEQEPRRTPGRMSREEARQMLDALRAEEKKLPMRQPRRLEDTEGAPSKGRDW